MSRSPIVSARRRRLPQTSARITSGWARTASKIGATRRLALLCKMRSPTDSTKVIPSRIFASVLAPKPFSPAIFPASAAARRSARLSIFSVSWSVRIFFGPSPGTRRSATRPGGVLRLSSSYEGSWPVVASWTILAYIVSPIPGVSARLPSAIASERSLGSPLSACAAL